MQTTRIMAFGLLLGLLCPGVSRADCAPEQRKIVLDKGEAVGGESFLKSYRCSLQPQSKNTDLRVEIYRANEATAGLILAGGSSKKLRLTLGSPKVLNNDVWRFYADLVNAFGTTEEIPPDAGTSLGVGDASAPDAISVKKFKHIETYGHALDYPAVDEIASLRKKILPDNLSYLYQSVFCQPGVGDCEKYRDQTVMLGVWRPMDASDVAAYAERAAAYNADVVKTRKGCGKDCAIVASPPKPLQLFARAAGANWPSDLLIITGSHTVQSKSEEGGCSGMGRDFWSFVYSPRRIYIDFALVENTSPGSIGIDALIGKHNKSAELRAVGPDVPASENIPIESDPLAAGQRMLVPIQIVLAAPSDDQGTFGEYKKSMEELHRLFGARGYKKGIEGCLQPDTAVQGLLLWTRPLDGRGLVANRGRGLTLRSDRPRTPSTSPQSRRLAPAPISFPGTKRAASGSSMARCFSKAPAKDKRYTEARDFEGLRTRFRLEEREPEIAHIEAAALVVTFDGGETLRLAPAMNEAQASLRLEVDLAWGEQLDLNFRLPEGRSPDRVVKSQLEITGYYERYDNLASDVEQPRLSSAPETQRAE